MNKKFYKYGLFLVVTAVLLSLMLEMISRRSGQEICYPYTIHKESEDVIFTRTEFTGVVHDVKHVLNNGRYVQTNILITRNVKIDRIIPEFRQQYFDASQKDSVLLAVNGKLKFIFNAGDTVRKEAGNYYYFLNKKSGESYKIELYGQDCCRNFDCTFIRSNGNLCYLDSECTI